jgi:hypothetical protein
LHEYGKYFSHQEGRHAAPLTAEQISTAITHSPNNAAGLDGVAASDLKLLSPVALRWLARMYTAIEEGADWPEQVLIGRTAWLDKTEGTQASLDPLDYRALAILSKVCRLYFAIRLGDIRAWIASWEDPELYAGTTAATGAEDAWYLNALDFELAKLRGKRSLGEVLTS